MPSNNSGGRLPSLAHRVDSARRDELYAKYGDLTSASRVSVNVANVARSIPMLPSVDFTFHFFGKRLCEFEMCQVNI